MDLTTDNPGIKTVLESRFQIEAKPIKFYEDGTVYVKIINGPEIFLPKEALTLEVGENLLRIRKKRPQVDGKKKLTHA